MTAKDLIDGVMAKNRLKRPDLRPNCAQKSNQWAKGGLVGGSALITLET